MKQKYIVLNNENLETLMEEVNIKLKGNWKISGSLVVSATNIYKDDKIINSKPHFYQSLTVDYISV